MATSSIARPQKPRRGASEDEDEPMPLAVDLGRGQRREAPAGRTAGSTGAQRGGGGGRSLTMGSTSSSTSSSSTDARLDRRYGGERGAGGGQEGGVGRGEEQHQYSGGGFISRGPRQPLRLIQTGRVTKNRAQQHSAVEAALLGASSGGGGGGGGGGDSSGFSSGTGARAGSDTNSGASSPAPLRSPQAAAFSGLHNHHHHHQHPHPHPQLRQPQQQQQQQQQHHHHHHSSSSSFSYTSTSLSTNSPNAGASALASTSLRSASNNNSSSSNKNQNSSGTSGPRRPPVSASSSRQQSSSSIASTASISSASTLSSVVSSSTSISSSSINSALDPRATLAGSLEEHLLLLPSSSSSSSTSTSNSTPAPPPSTAMPAMPFEDKPVLSFWGPDPVPLPSRFARIKRNLIAGHEAELEQCWARLIRALRTEVEHIEDLGAHLIPSIEFTDVDNAAQAARFGRDLHRYGVGVVRRVVPKTDADSMMHETVNYLDALTSGGNNSVDGNRGSSSKNVTNGSRSHAAANGRRNGSPATTAAPTSTAIPGPREAYNLKPLRQDPTCYDFFWTPAQVRARAHPNVLRAQRFMMGLWETTPDDRLAIRLPITYVDRIRIHGTRASGSSGEGSSDGQRSSAYGSVQGSLSALGEQPPQSADDWITALQSSAGIIAQVDNGSLERWEPDGYQRGGTYDHVFHGQWEDYDPWESASRVPATMDLYNGYGACTIFRMFQGVLALSTIEPGMIRLLPSPKLATAYYLLRPFFSARTPAPEVRSGPEWDAYLDPDNWRLERDPDTIIHGAVPGHAQRITEHWHPHLYLRSSMITLPTLQPGDYIFWHPDLPYHISSNNPGLKTPSTTDNDVSMLVYIPAAPLTQTNALYLARQRKAYQRGNPGPDFDSSGRGSTLEDPDVRPGEKVIAESGGTPGLQAMGLAPWELVETRSTTPKVAIREKSPRVHSNGHHHGGSSGKPNGGSTNGGLNGLLSNKRKHDEDADMEGTDYYPYSAGTRSPSRSTSSSNVETEVVRLSNIILFPDRSMLGYSV